MAGVGERRERGLSEAQREAAEPRHRLQKRGELTAAVPGWNPSWRPERCCNGGGGGRVGKPQEEGLRRWGKGGLWILTSPVGAVRGHAAPGSSKLG